MTCVLFRTSKQTFPLNLIFMSPKINFYFKPHVIADFTTPGRSPIYGLPCPYADSLDPMYLYYTLMFQYYPQKSATYTYR